MKLAVSNIAWDPAENEAVLSLLSSLGVTAVEVAPTKLWPDWHGATQAAAAQHRSAFAARGFSVPALQAILFGRPDLALFGSPDVQSALERHLTLTADLAASLGAKCLVFGAPKQRDRGSLTEAEAEDAAAPLLSRVAEACAERNVQLCLEPNPKAYGCNFLTHWYEVERLAARVDHPGVGIHLDAACIAVEGDSPLDAIAACQGRIAHFHVTEPNLQDFSSPTLDHAAIGSALAAASYDGWLSIEMRRSSDPLQSIERAVRFVLDQYPSLRE